MSLLHDQAFHPWGRLGYFDLRVYRGAAQLILHGRPLYDAGIWHWAPFTYPPFAAIAFTPLALLPLAVDELVVTTLSLRSPRSTSPSDCRDRRRARMRGWVSR